MSLPRKGQLSHGSAETQGASTSGWLVTRNIVAPEFYKDTNAGGF
jgi:hypothetical protein